MRVYLWSDEDGESHLDTSDEPGKWSDSPPVDLPDDICQRMIDADKAWSEAWGDFKDAVRDKALADTKCDDLDEVEDHDDIQQRIYWWEQCYMSDNLTEEHLAARVDGCDHPEDARFDKGSGAECRRCGMVWLPPNDRNPEGRWYG